MGPRMPTGGSGPQLGFIQRKTALSKHGPARFSDGPTDGLTPRGPGRYLASKWNKLSKNKRLDVGFFFISLSRKFQSLFFFSSAV